MMASDVLHLIAFHSIQNKLYQCHKKVYIETYGCQMNVADSEVVVSILKGAGYDPTEIINDAGLILINTCSIRDNAEQRIWGRLSALGHLKKEKQGSEDRDHRMHGGKAEREAAGNRSAG